MLVLATIRYMYAMANISIWSVKIFRAETLQYCRLSEEKYIILYNIFVAILENWYFINSFWLKLTFKYLLFKSVLGHCAYRMNCDVQKCPYPILLFFRIKLHSISFLYYLYYVSMLKGYENSTSLRRCRT